MAIDAHVIVNPVARVKTKRVFLAPWGPDLDFSSLGLAACLRMAIAPHQVMPDPNKYIFSESPSIELSIGYNPK